MASKDVIGCLLVGRLILAFSVPTGLQVQFR